MDYESGRITNGYGLRIGFDDAVVRMEGLAPAGQLNEGDALIRPRSNGYVRGETLFSKRTRCVGAAAETVR